MKKNYLMMIMLLFCMTSRLANGQTVVINSGTAGTPEYAVGPVYMSPTLFYKASRYAYLYTQDELAAAGIVSGSNITQLGWMKNNVSSSLGGGILRIYMKNSTATNYSLATETWTNLNAGTTLVYENLNYLVPATASPGYITFALSNTLTYTGGSLEISVEWDATAFSGTLATGSFDWVWSTVTDRIYGNGGSTLSNTLSSTMNNVTIDNRRPFIQITYVPSTACINPPVAGTATANVTGPVCQSSSVNLNLTGNSVGSGLTFEWESSPSNTPFTPTSISTPAAGSLLTITPTATRWYRAKLVCNSGTPAYSTPVQVSINNGLAAGTYTINNGSPTTGSNFNSFADAISAMSCGIQGPVVFNVATGSGPYNETVSFGAIAGTSAVNTIKINGKGNIVQFANTTSNRVMLTLSGTKYLKIDSLTFKGLDATFGWGALFINGAERDSITNCTFDLSAVTSTTAANVNGIVFSASNTAAATSGLNGKLCFIGNNRIFCGNGDGGLNYGIAIAAGGNDSNTVQNNIIENYRANGIYINSAKGSIIHGNTIHRENKTTGIVAGEGISTITGDMSGSRITANRIYSPGGTAGSATVFRAISLLGDGTTTSPVIVANNVIYKMNQGGASAGIYASAALYNKVYHNTISFDQVMTGTAINYGMHIIGTNTGTDFKNNNISITAGSSGIKYGFFYNAAASVNDAQKNNVYVNSNQAGDQNYGYYVIAYATKAAFQAAYPALEVGSLTANPLFANLSSGNLLPTNPQLYSNGANLLTSVSTDINGTARTITPTPGAYEIQPVIGPDAGLVNLISPTAPFCKGLQPVSVSVINTGTTQLTSFQIHWKVNGVTQTPYSFGGLLDILTGTGQYLDTLTLGNATINPGSNTIQAWVVVTGDVNSVNDSLHATVSPATFTIDATADTICSGANVTINLSPSAGYTTGMLQWQSSPTPGSFLPIAGTDVVSYTATNMTASRYYRVFINSGINGCYSDTARISVVTAQLTSATGGSRCDPGTVQLSSVTPAGVNVNWYDTPTGGTALGTGSTFTTPPISVTTTYYAEPVTGGGQGSVGAPTNGGNTGYTLEAGLFFDVFASSMTIHGVYVYPVGTGTGTVDIALKDPSGNNISTYTANLTGTAAPGIQTYVPLNFTVPAGTGYALVMLNRTGGVASLIRDGAAAITGGGFPFTLPGIMSITQGRCCPTATSTSYYYFYNWQVSSGCTGTRTPVVATVVPAPVVNLGNDTIVCGAGNLTLNAGNTGAAYLWDNATTAQTRTVNTTGTYHVAVTQTGCTSRDTINVTYSANPVVNLGNDTSICLGNNLTLNAGNTGMAYLWDNATTNQTRTVNAAGSYYVTVTNVNNCKGRDTIQVVLLPYPVVNLGNDTSICGTGSLVLNAGNTGATYLWDNASVAQTRTVSASGTYYVAVSNTGCAGRDTINVTFNPLPIVNLGNDTAICDGNSLTLNAGNTGATYLWDDATTSQSRMVLTSGSYFVTVTGAGNCKGSDTLILTVNDNPVVHLGNDTAICTGSSLLLDAGNAGADYLWDNASVNQTRSVSAVGLYFVTVTDGNNCSGSDSIQLNLIPPASATISATDNGDGNYTFTATNVQGSVTSMSWDFGDQTAGQTGTTVQHSYAANGTYTVTLTLTGECGTVTITYTVTVTGKVGIDQVELNNEQLLIYPNPAKSMLTIENKSGLVMEQIAVQNILGQQIYIVVPADSNKHKLQLSGYASGMYTLTIRTKKGMIVRKFEVIR